MPETNVIISIKARQTMEGAETETTELVTEGLLRQEAGACALSYQESEVTGMKGTLTTFQVEENCVTLTRAGQFNSQMVFQEGRRHISVYETPYGSLSMAVNTRRLRADLGPRGGDIEIEYRIEIDHQVTGLNLFQISVREKQPSAITQ